MTERVSTEPPSRWVSIDPGSVHVGMAWWRGAEIDHIEERTPVTSMTDLVAECPQMLVIEEFRLYPTHAQTLTGSTMGTSQVIGAMTWWARQLPVYMQPAAIKIPTRALIKLNGDQTPAGSIHAQDAFLHGYHWLHRGRHLDSPRTLFNP